MSKRQTLFHSVCLVLLIGTGFGMIWAIAFEWCMGLMQQARDSAWRHQTLMVRIDGTLLIETRFGRDYYNPTFQTLDGVKVEITRPDWLARARVDRSPQLAQRVFWPNRIQAYTDYGHPQVFWYFVHDGLPHGRGYFVGYNNRTKYRVAFISRTGFSDTLPTLSQRFPVRSPLPHAFTQQEYVQAGYEPRSYRTYVTDEEIRPWSTYLISGNELLWIDFRTGTIQKILEADDMISVDFGRQRLDHGEGPDTNHSGKTKLQVVVRCSDWIMVLDPDGRHRRDVPIPKVLRASASLAIYALSDEQCLIDADSYDGIERTHTHRLYWIDSAGQVMRQKDVVLDRGHPTHTFTQASLSALVAPAPALIVSAATFFQPRYYLERGIVSPYFAALWRSLSEYWLALVVTFGVSAILTQLCWRRHSRYAADGRKTWAVFVFLFGLPGFVGYLFHRNWPVLEACPRCDGLVPRDRNACSVCGEMFPEPEPTGCEIFA